jgi:hypothetical protein
MPNVWRPDASLERATPAMAVGMADHVWTVHEIAALLD